MDGLVCGIDGGMFGQDRSEGNIIGFKPASACVFIWTWYITVSENGWR